jgi:hypothetical protein
MRSTDHTRATFASQLLKQNLDLRLSFGAATSSQQLDCFKHYFPHHRLPITVDGILPSTHGVEDHNISNPLFRHCAVNIVTESSCQHETNRWHSIFITEKTFKAFAMWQLPIWWAVPGLVTAVKNLGFDVFDDIINHDYQHADTVFQRCWQAVYLNRELLQDKHRLCQLKTHLHERFQRNVDLLYQDTVGQHWIKTYSEWCTRDQQQFLHAVLRVPEYDVRQGAKYLKHNFGITS